MGRRPDAHALVSSKEGRVVPAPLLAEAAGQAVADSMLVGLSCASSSYICTVVEISG